LDPRPPNHKNVVQSIVLLIWEPLIAQTKLKRKKINGKDLMDSFTACTQSFKTRDFFLLVDDEEH